MLQGEGQAANNNVEHGGVIPQDRENFALSAGFALGLVNLGRGHASSGSSNEGIVNKLKRLIAGSDQGMCSWSKWTYRMIGYTVVYSEDHFR